MQIIQTLNDTIRVLFSPLHEGFKLLDFLLVQDGDNKFLAQIIEVYDDKYDASQNVARVKLFFRVNNNGEVFDYDHYTPSKECEIKKIRREEILTFVNEGKESLTIGLNYQNDEPFDINLDFLKNSAVIFADKIEQSNVLSAHLAKTLSRYNKHSVIIDYSGTLEIEGAKKLIAAKDIKLPLDFYSLDYIWDKGLSTASLETQAICREIFNEVQTFAKNTPDGFIPYDKFLKVVQIQYKATPIVELTVLLNKLKAYQKYNIFAKTKKDFECLNKSIGKNEITIIDFSLLKSEWHKEYTQFVVRSIDDGCFAFLRLNDTNSDIDLINFIYDKKPDVHFIPSVSYSFKKMPHIIERTKNYILLPTLNPRREFGHANYELCSINNNECILFGENSENFIFTIKNNIFEKQQPKEPKGKKIIKLKLDDINNSPIELDFDEAKITNTLNAHASTPQESIITDEELDFFQEPAEISEPEEDIAEDFSEEKKPSSGEDIELHREEISAQHAEQEIEDEPVREFEESQSEDLIEDYTEIIEQPEQNFEEEYLEDEQEPVEAQVLYEEPEAQSTTQDEVYEEVKEAQDAEDFQDVEDLQNEDIEQASLQTQNNTNTKFKNILEDESEDSEENQDEDESISLEDIAQQSIEATFSEVVETEGTKSKKNEPEEDAKNTLVIDENVVIDLEKIKETVDENENELPIFKSKKEKTKEKYEFNTGDMVEHDKYGTGEVVKVINYANRSLLQINFKEVGKRLLDPEIAKIKPV